MFLAQQVSGAFKTNAEDLMDQSWPSGVRSDISLLAHNEVHVASDFLAWEGSGFKTSGIAHSALKHDQATRTLVDQLRALLGLSPP